MSYIKNMVDHVLLAEFHDTRGAELTYEYPYTINTYALYRDVACYMIPENLHNSKQDTTLFITRHARAFCPVMYDPSIEV